MTPRESLLAVINGEPADHRPLIAIPGDPLGGPGTAGQRSNVRLDTTDPSHLRVAEILNPFGRALGLGLDLNQALVDDPKAGGARLDYFVMETIYEAEVEFEKGAEAVLYYLFGATPTHTTPMQYGGYYLERDREILTRLASLGPVIVFVVGGDAVYLDFVSDLPATVFGWDAEASGFSSAYVRSIRSGVQLSQDPASEIELSLTERLRQTA